MGVATFHQKRKKNYRFTTQISYRRWIHRLPLKELKVKLETRICYNSINMYKREQLMVHACPIEQTKQRPCWTTGQPIARPRPLDRWITIISWNQWSTTNHTSSLQTWNSSHKSIGVDVLTGLVLCTGDLQLASLVNWLCRKSINNIFPQAYHSLIFVPWNPAGHHGFDLLVF